MSRNPQPPENEPAGPPHAATAGLPADFFEGSGEPLAGTAGVPPAAEPEGRDPRRTESRERRPPPPPPRGRRSTLAIVATILLGNVLFLLFGLLAGWALTNKGVIPQATRPTTEREDRAGSETSRGGAVTPGEHSDLSALVAEIKGLKGGMESLGREFARLEGRVAAVPSPAPAADLKPVLARLEEVSKAAGRLAPLPEEVHALANRFGPIEDRVESIREDVAGLAEALKARAAAMTVPTPSAGPAASAAPPPSKEDEARGQGVLLYKQGKFAEARERFLKHVEAAPDDARGWYLAALANGFATNQWNGGETERLLKRGVERERAGTPGRTVIDAQFAEIGDAEGGRWLREWRERAARR